MRPMYCRGSTAASLTWRAKTCRADATLIVAAEDAAGALPPCGAAASDVFTCLVARVPGVKIFVTSAGDVVSLLTRSRTASAGFASWLRGAPMAPKYEAMSPLSPQYATRPSDRTNTLWKPANTSAEGWWIGAHDRGPAPGGDGVEEGDDRRRRRGVEAARGLVQDDHAGLLHERDGEAESAALAAGQTLEQESCRRACPRKT